jgi:AraC family transcriptional regulator
MHADLEDGSPTGPLYGESLASTLCVYLAQKYGVFRPKLQTYRGGIPKVRLDRVLKYIRANLSQEIRLHELAQVAGMSTHYFCELFKQSSGLSPYRYVLKQKIDGAKASLMDPKMDIATAGAMAGFINQSHFTKVFRKLVGVTPTDFRARTLARRLR